MLKKLIPILFVLISCKKQTITNTEKDEIIYYKIGQLNYFNKKYFTEVKYIKHHENYREPQSEDTCYCPLPLMIEDFNIQQLNNNEVKIYWKSHNEENTMSYIVCKSLNLKEWQIIYEISKNNGTYSYIDYLK